MISACLVPPVAPTVLGCDSGDSGLPEPDAGGGEVLRELSLGGEQELLFRMKAELLASEAKQKVSQAELKMFKQQTQRRLNALKLPEPYSPKRSMNVRPAWHGVITCAK